jgi:hypothetical protein
MIIGFHALYLVRWLLSESFSLSLAWISRVNYDRHFVQEILKITHTHAYC